MCFDNIPNLKVIRDFIKYNKIDNLIYKLQKRHPITQEQTDMRLQGIRGKDRSRFLKDRSIASGDLQSKMGWK